LKAREPNSKKTEKFQKENSPQILVVDDSPNTLSLLTEVLTDDGYKVQTATSGIEALTAVSGEMPDLILLDVKMPDMDGYEVCRQLKSEEYNSNVPVIFISGLYDATDKVKGFNAGGVDYITKPFQFEEVLARIEMHLTLHRLQKQLEGQNIQLQREIEEREQVEEELKKHKSHLEEIVAERTAKLRNINKDLQREIADRKQAEQALRESEEKYRSLATTTDSMYIVDNDYKYLFMNEKHLSRFAVPLDEIVGRPYSEFHSKKTTKDFIRKVDLVFVTGESVQDEYRSVRDNQYFIRTFSPVKDREGRATVAVTVASKNITERKKVEKALQESEELYRVLAEKSFAGVYVIQDGKICFVNSKGASYTGYTPEELIGRESMSVIHPEDRENLKKNAIEMLRGERTLPYEFRVITREGKIIWFMETVTSIPWKGKRAVLGNCMDLTDRKRMEEQIHSLSITDSLTGLHNRRGFLTLAEQQMKFSDRHQRDMLLFFADLDGMKRINDTLGHEEGDAALIDVAAILQETFRSSDIIARVGGDEFAILAIDATEISPETIMTRLKNQINDHNKKEKRHYKISISMGIARYDPEKPCSLDELMSRADKLMYAQKRSKKRSGSVRVKSV
jgi:diguanylate cyclase (GGDEF)-like protein/PAS domain S-box-containing protein